MHKQTTESKQKEETGKQPLFFPRAENKEFHNKAMQPIENQPPALLALCWKGCVSELLRLYHCGRNTLRCRFEPEPIPSKVCANSISLARKRANFLRLLRLFAAIPLFEFFVCFVVSPSTLNSQLSTRLSYARQPWN